MKKTLFAFVLTALITTACASAPRGEVLAYVVAPLSGWQAND